MPCLVCTGMIITEGTLLLKRSLSPRHWSHANLRNQALHLHDECWLISALDTEPFLPFFLLFGLKLCFDMFKSCMGWANFTPWCIYWLKRNEKKIYKMISITLFKIRGQWATLLTWPTALNFDPSSLLALFYQMWHKTILKQGAIVQTLETLIILNNFTYLILHVFWIRRFIFSLYKVS